MTRQIFESLFTYCVHTYYSSCGTFKNRKPSLTGREIFIKAHFVYLMRRDHSDFCTICTKYVFTIEQFSIDLLCSIRIQNPEIRPTGQSQFFTLTYLFLILLFSNSPFFLKNASFSSRYPDAASQYV